MNYKKTLYSSERALKFNDYATCVSQFSLDEWLVKKLEKTYLKV